ncbi:hypothetical protein LTR12_005751 [Friedmanniomyces endolithicus]|nr:hypothetical protein LTR12_005751 [Friedmanniomyces endolithicus]
MSGTHPGNAAELYNPIASWQTRILRLHTSSGGKNDVLRADLLVAGLVHDEGVVFGMDNEEPTKYEAISYSWGPDNATERIIVNGLRRHINPSLAGALRRFRLPEESRCLWVDAICINQADNAEKSAQVRSMFTIFRKAWRVLAWLGDEGAGGSQALASYEAQFSTFKENPRANRRGVVLDEEDTYDELAAVALVPWPRRAWVQQEVFAARELTLYYGKCEMSLDHYFGLLERLCKSSVKRRLDELERQRKVLASLCGLRRSDERINQLELGRLLSAKREHSASFLESAETRLRKAEPAVSAYDATRLEQGLSRSRHLDARDPRDHVYALLGLTHQNIARSQSEEARSVRGTAMYIDYSKSVTRVFQDATRCILNRDRRLNILTYSRRRGASRLKLDLPSWVVDWSSLTREMKYGDLDLYPEDSMLTRQEHNHSGTITLHGFRLGRLESISDDTSIGIIEQAGTIAAAANRTLTLDFRISLITPGKQSLKSVRAFTQSLSTSTFQLPGANAVGLAASDLFVQVDGWDAPIILRKDGAAHGGRFRLVHLFTDWDFVLKAIHEQRVPQKYMVSTKVGRVGSTVEWFAEQNRVTSPNTMEDFVVC